MFTKRNNRSRSAGFTLLEMVLAMVLLALLSGALFKLVQASFEATASLQQNQTEDENIYAFIDLCRNTFSTLPARASIHTAVDQSDGNALPQLIIDNAPAFSWGDNEYVNGTTILSARPQSDGFFSLSETHQAASTTANQNPLLNQDWLPLLTGLRQISWRFFDSRSQTWQDDWSDTGFHPAVIQVNIVPSSSTSTNAITANFWLPPLVRVQRNPNTQP